MKIYLILIILASFSYSLPHFIFNGIESSSKCLIGKVQISFTIYGTLNGNVNLGKISIDDYYLEYIGFLQCSFSKNENLNNTKRKHKIICSKIGSFPTTGYILDEPKVHGFDFLNKKGKSTWPTKPEKKTFLIVKCGTKIEVDSQSQIFDNIPKNYSNPLNKVNKLNVNNALSELPERILTTEENMCIAMKKVQQKYSLNQAESAYLVYIWLLENIQYDCYGLNHNTVDFDENNSYNNGKGVCSGYSQIFETMCKALGLEVAIIIGYSKGTSYSIGTMPKKTEHVWNAVKIDSVHYLVDSTWGAGTCTEDTFTKNSKDFYFCTNPRYFIRSHFPVESQWQLLSKIITLQKFVDMSKLNDEFYENGFKTISPDSSIIKVAGKTKVIKLTYDKSKTDLAISNKLLLLEGNTYKEQPNTCIYTKSNGNVKITFAANKKGEYKLIIYGGPIGSQSIPQVLEYKIINSKNSKKTINFPTLYERYSRSEIQIITPLNSPLKKGIFISFKVNSTLENIYVIVGNKLYRELDKKGNGLFIGESVYIFGNVVRLSTKIGETHSIIAEYNTTNNTNKKGEPTFPECFKAPKNILYSPLTDTLKKGKTYTFKIKCKSAKNIFVLDYNSNITNSFKVYKLNKKSGSIFYRKLKINGSGGKVRIAQYKNKSYPIIYSYKV